MFKRAFTVTRALRIMGRCCDVLHNIVIIVYFTWSIVMEYGQMYMYHTVT